MIVGGLLLVASLVVYYLVWRSRRRLIIFDLNGVLCFRLPTSEEADVTIAVGTRGYEYWKLRPQLETVLFPDLCVGHTLSGLTHAAVWTSRTQRKAEQLTRAIEKRTHVPFCFVWCQDQCIKVQDQNAKGGIRFIKHIPLWLRFLYGRIIMVDDSPEKMTGNFVHVQREWTTEQLSDQVLQHMEVSKVKEI